ncbi:hypothetical protein [Geminocystis herdmanii]|uniref:hypothetical protein n=1 Tax=Geminocystis herdmanii TaxID=669359 RepID=UPI00034B106D|nr:hypothetical protein [Geminocystis herdmanii]
MANFSLLPQNNKLNKVSSSIEPSPIILKSRSLKVALLDRMYCILSFRACRGISTP